MSAPTSPALAEIVARARLCDAAQRDLLDAIRAARAEHTMDEIAAALGVTRVTVYNRLRSTASPGPAGPCPPRHGQPPG
jgi:AcrR family transcriptional regulator